MRSSNFVIIKILFLFAIWAKSLQKWTKSDPKLIVISMDGLMFNQVQPNSMPFVTEFYKNGVHCPQLQPVFPTKTLVNHFSIATGLYGASHGVTANVIYDNKEQKLLTYSREIFSLKPNITPIWTLNEQAGKHSAVSMWSAAKFEFRGAHATYNEPFNRKIQWKERVDNIIQLLMRDESQVDLVMFYNEHPDFEDHATNPTSPQVLASLRDMDNMVKYLSEQLDIAGLSDVTDIIILSDHGRDTFSFNRDDVDGSIIDLRRVVGNNSCDMYGSSPVFQVIAKAGFDQTEICLELKKGAAKNRNYKVYFDDELKKRWHIRNSQRFGPCTVVAEPGYVFQDLTEQLKKWTDYDKLVPGTKYGVHGYDDLSPIMQAVFLAKGPRFKSGVEMPSIQNIDLYYLFAKLLNIEEMASNLEIDGINRTEIWQQILKEPSQESNSDRVILIVICVASILSVVILTFLVYKFIKRNKIKLQMSSESTSETTERQRRF